MFCPCFYRTVKPIVINRPKHVEDVCYVNVWCLHPSNCDGLILLGPRTVFLFMGWKQFQYYSQTLILILFLVLIRHVSAAPTSRCIVASFLPHFKEWWVNSLSLIMCSPFFCSQASVFRLTRLRLPSDVYGFYVTNNTIKALLFVCNAHSGFLSLRFVFIAFGTFLF